ncbi:MAG: arabinase, partial [Oscillospiraceae bacterium]|nr:arabinase [Oscillospiraceae bacterium]
MKNKFIKKTFAVMISTMMTASAFGTVIPELIANAVYNRVAVHDPSVVKLEDGSYYIIGSHLAAARSEDLCNWTITANSSAGTANTTYFDNIYTDLVIPNAWSNTSAGYDLSGNLWAPDIIWNPVMNKWCMYLSVNGNDWHSSIVLCTADKIDGPYNYVDTIVYSGFETNPLDNANNYKNTDVEKVLGSNPDLSRYLNSDGRWNASYGTNAIDPCVFYDEDNHLWMIYGSWFGGIYMLELDENTGLRDYNINYETVTNVSDAYMGKKVAGGYYASGEGPYIEYMKAPDSNKG